ADDLPPQVPPVRIARLDQLVLPRAPPALHLLFALDGDLDILVRLEPHQPLAIVLLGEAGDEPFAMFLGAADEVVGDTGINGAAFAAGNDVDEVRPLHAPSEARDV